CRHKRRHRRERDRASESCTAGKPGRAASIADEERILSGPAADLEETSERPAAAQGLVSRAVRDFASAGLAAALAHPDPSAVYSCPASLAGPAAQRLRSIPPDG